MEKLCEVGFKNATKKKCSIKSAKKKKRRENGRQLPESWELEVSL